MPSWKPGDPINGRDDARAFLQWKRFRKLKCPDEPLLTEGEEREYLRWRRFCQRQSKNRRRREMRRIEYCANPIAEAVIDSLRTRYVGGDASSIINRIITEWSEERHLLQGAADD
jgi:hypothetical protein